MISVLLKDSVQIMGAMLFVTIAYLFIKPLITTELKQLQFIFFIVTIAIVFPTVLQSFAIVEQLLSTLTTLFIALIPAISALLLILTSFFSAVAWQPIGLLFINSMIAFVQYFCLPLILIALLLDVSSRFLPAIAFSKLAQLIRLLVLSLLSVFVMTISSIVAVAGTASWTISKTVTSPLKKLVEQNIPLIGSILVESFSIVTRFGQSASTIGIIVIVFFVGSIVFFPALQLFSKAFMCKLLAALLQPFLPSTIVEMLEDFSKTLFSLTAVACIFALAIIVLASILVVIARISMGL